MKASQNSKTDQSSDRYYRYLDPSEVVGTANALIERISCRFPNSDLLQISKQILTVAKEGQNRSVWMAQPLIGIRVLCVILPIFIVTLIAYSSLFIKFDSGSFNGLEIVQALESATSEIIILGAGLMFLVNIEARIKRKRGLLALHELRAMAHIIDMHQLTKDPARLNKASAIWTAVSPSLELDAFHLTRYLDYCSEMLSLLGKIAALYAQRFADPVLLSGVDEIESLTNGLSRKIWQKIMIIQMSHKGPQ